MTTQQALPARTASGSQQRADWAQSEASGSGEKYSRPRRSGVRIRAATSLTFGPAPEGIPGSGCASMNRVSYPASHVVGNVRGNACGRDDCVADCAHTHRVLKGLRCRSFSTRDISAEDDSTPILVCRRLNFEPAMHRAGFCHCDDCAHVSCPRVVFAGFDKDRSFLTNRSRVASFARICVAEHARVADQLRFVVICERRVIQLDPHVSVLLTRDKLQRINRVERNGTAADGDVVSDVCAKIVHVVFPDSPVRYWLAWVIVVPTELVRQELFKGLSKRRGAVIGGAS
jgi:hypothetical protein